MVTGNSKCPRSFRKKTGLELGFDYHSNKTALMNTELFFPRLRRFDAYIGKTPERKDILLIDNCKAHGKIYELPQADKCGGQVYL